MLGGLASAVGNKQVEQDKKYGSGGGFSEGIFHF